MLRSVAISSLLLMGAVSVAQADVFRWVDDHGGVHYSDKWVPGSEVIKSTASHTKNSVADSPHHDTPKPVVASAPDAADPSQKAAAQAVKQDMEKVRGQKCKEAKDKYDKAIQARRIYKPKEGAKEGDDLEYLSDEEADAYRVKVREEMQDYCGSSATKSAE